MSASLTHEQARRVLDAGSARAEEIGQPTNIAVVDDGGHLVAFGRMDGAIKASIDISTRKAVTSILMDLPTADLTDLVQPGAELYGLGATAGGMVTFGGGIPPVRGGATVGAVGVSAGSVEQDVTVATAAAAALDS
ncbi:heme-binding protein [Modestobacter sp. DSM 44400]|uniref:GlcG/HbpS family heme-binding protein n=1 Tax=Modestobacter sp. DSM 44400 TaxID=1550230 RepID=UPI000B851A87|nr:heme-binding protein [Modestobacter sp. DSM 44400]